MKIIQDENLELNNGEYLKSYEIVKAKMFEKGFKFLSSTQCIGFITNRFEHWMSSNEQTEPTIVIIEVLNNNDAIVYTELDINELY